MSDPYTQCNYTAPHYGPNDKGASGKMMDVTQVTGGIAAASHVAVRALTRTAARRTCTSCSLRSCCLIKIVRV